MQRRATPTAVPCSPPMSAGSWALSVSVLGGRGTRGGVTSMPESTMVTGFPAGGGVSVSTPIGCAPPLGVDERVGEVARRASRSAFGALHRRARRARRVATGSRRAWRRRCRGRASAQPECLRPRGRRRVGAARRGQQLDKRRRPPGACRGRGTPRGPRREQGRRATRDEAHWRVVRACCSSSMPEGLLSWGCGARLRRPRGEPRRSRGHAVARGRAPRRAARSRGPRGVERFARPTRSGSSTSRGSSTPPSRWTPRSRRRSSSARSSTVERELGRTRDGPRYGPRTVDLDLLLLDGVDARRAGTDAATPPAARACVRPRAARGARSGARRAGARLGDRPPPRI